MSRPLYELGGIIGTEIVPAAIGLYLGYKVLKWFSNRKKQKEAAKTS